MYTPTAFLVKCNEQSTAWIMCVCTVTSKCEKPHPLKQDLHRPSRYKSTFLLRIVLSRGRGFLCNLRYDASIAVKSNLCPFISGKPLQSLPAKPRLADAAARFRVTRDMASTLSMDNHPTGRLVVNSVGDILRHEKLRRLKKVSRLLVFFSEGFVFFCSQRGCIGISCCS